MPDADNTPLVLISLLGGFCAVLLLLFLYRRCNVLYQRRRSDKQETPSSAEALARRPSAVQRLGRLLSVGRSSSVRRNAHMAELLQKQRMSMGSASNARVSVSSLQNVQCYKAEANVRQTSNRLQVVSVTSISSDDSCQEYPAAVCTSTVSNSAHSHPRDTTLHHIRDRSQLSSVQSTPPLKHRDRASYTTTNAYGNVVTAYPTEHTPHFAQPSPLSRSLSSPAAHCSSRAVVAAKPTPVCLSSQSQSTVNYNSQISSAVVPVTDSSDNMYTIDLAQCDQHMTQNGSSWDDVNVQSIRLQAHLKNYSLQHWHSRAYIEEEENTRLPPLPTRADSCGYNDQQHPHSAIKPAFVALRHYFPMAPDELELNVGDQLTTHQRFNDGWTLGSNLRSGQFGVYSHTLCNAQKHPLSNGSLQHFPTDESRVFAPHIA